MLLTKTLQDATTLYLSDPTNGFNALFATAAQQHGVNPFTIDWTVGSVQFFPFAGDPDDLDESTPNKYPLSFLHGVRSHNTHQSRGRTFSGPVELYLSIWFTHKASSIGKAGPAMESICNAVEAALTQMFADGNWPQRYGASNAVCASPACARTSLESGGEAWRQSVACNLMFTLDTN